MRARTERGSTSVEAVLIVPVLMVVLVMIVQCVLWIEAEESVELAAAGGVRAAGAYGAHPGDGVVRAEEVLHGRGSGVEHLRVTSRLLPGGVIELVVTGSAIAIVPGMHLPVSSTAAGPPQTFRPSE
jgi:hypothetical protein